MHFESAPQLKPGAQSVVVPHVLLHVPSVPHLKGEQGVDSPVFAIDERPSSEHFAPCTHFPAWQLNPDAHCSLVVQADRQPLSLHA